MRRFIGEIAFAAGLGATIWLVLRLGWRPIEQALATIGVGGVLLLALAHGPTLIFLGLAWWMLAKDAPGSRPWIFLWGRVLRDAGGELLPFSQIGGYALGARAVALGGVSGLTAAVSGLLDVFVEQAAKIPYAMAAVALLLWFAPASNLIAPSLAVLAMTVCVVVGLVLKRRWVRARVRETALAVARKWPGLGAPDRASAEAAVAHALGPRRRVAASLGLHVIAWCLGAFETWLAFKLLGAPIDLGQALVIDGLFSAARVFAFGVPAAIGVQEAAYVVLAGVFGVPAPTAVAYSLVRRGRDLALGAPALLIWQLHERERRRLQLQKARTQNGLPAVQHERKQLLD